MILMALALASKQSFSYKLMYTLSSCVVIDFLGFINYFVSKVLTNRFSGNKVNPVSQFLLQIKLNLNKLEKAHCFTGLYQQIYIAVILVIPMQN